MIRDTGLLSETELATVAGGVISLIGTVAHPHIPRNHDLLTPQQIAKLLAPMGGFNPPTPQG